MGLDSESLNTPPPSLDYSLDLLAFFSNRQCFSVLTSISFVSAGRVQMEFVFF